MTQPPSPRVLYVLWKQWFQGDNELKHKAQIIELLEKEPYVTESYRVKKALAELHKLGLVQKDSVATGNAGTRPAGYRIVTDGSIVVSPATAFMLVELRNFRPLPIEERIFVDHLHKKGLRERDRAFSEADLLAVLSDCCASEYVKKDQRSLLSPTPKLHTHGFYLTLVAKHVASPKISESALEPEQGLVGGRSATSDSQRQQQLLDVVLPAIGKDSLASREKKEFSKFIESDIAPLDASQFVQVLGHLNHQFGQLQPSHFKAGDITTVIKRLRTILKEYQGPPTSNS